MAPLVELKKSNDPDLRDVSRQKGNRDRSVIEYWILADQVSGVTAFMVAIGAMTTELLMRGYKQPFVTSHL